MTAIQVHRGLVRAEDSVKVEQITGEAVTQCGFVDNVPLSTCEFSLGLEFCLAQWLEPKAHLDVTGRDGLD